MLMHTIRAFYNWDNSCEIILVLPASQQSYWQILLNEYDFDIPVKSPPEEKQDFTLSKTVFVMHQENLLEFMTV